jgi:hypothetical protein
MIKPLFNAQDDEWVVMVGRYMLNMGALEMATRLIIARIEGTDSALSLVIILLSALLSFEGDFRARTRSATSGP